MNIKKIKKYGVILRDWNGANASFTMFSREGVNIFLVNLSDPIKRNFVSIGFTKCTFLSGPVKWKNIEINLEYNEGGSEIIVTDKKSGFCVKCDDVFIGVDLDKVLE